MANKKFEKWVKDIVAEYMDVLNLSSYRLREIKHAEDPDDGAYLQVYCGYPYRHFTIRYFDNTLDMWKNKEFDTLRHGIMHELMHIVVSELQDKASTRSTPKEISDAVETLVDHMAIVMRKYVN